MPSLRPLNESLGTPDYERIFGAYISDLSFRGSQWRAPCPIHKGVRDSFSIEAETGRWTCHSACATGGDAIQFIQAIENCEFKSAVGIIETLIGRTITNGNSKPGNLGRVVAEYLYNLPDGSRFLKVLRYEPKDFRQQSWNGSQWIWKTEGRDKEIIYRAALVADSDLVFVVEGEKDADALVDLGLAATCNPGGAGKWNAKHASFLRGKHVVVIPDDDEAGRAHCDKVSRSLSGSALSVRVLRLESKDVSDWLALGYSVQELRLLADAAPDWIPNEQAAEDQEEHPAVEAGPPEASAVPEAPAPGDDHYDGGGLDGHPADQRIHFNEIGRQILRDRLIIADRNKNIFEYVKKKWEQVTPETLRSYALRGDNAFHTNTKRRNEVVNYITATTYMESIPWRSLKSSEVAFSNGVFDLDTWTMREHRALDYLEWYPPVPLEEGALCPRWLQALSEWFPDSREIGLKIAAIQEFFGYVLMPEALFKKSLYLIGHPDTGKSLFLKILSAMVGPDGLANIKPGDMGDARRIAPIKGRALNVVGEVDPAEVFSDTGFKTLVSTGDTVTIDQKYERAHSYRPFAKHVLCSNDFPQIRDSTDATFKRIMFIGFGRAFSAQEQDPFLERELLCELPGITAWALLGAKRLWNNRGQFTQFQEASDLLEQCRRDNNPVVNFAEEFLTVSFGVAIPFGVLHSMFNKWNQRNVSHRTLEAMFRQAGFKIGVRENEGLKRRHLLDMNYSRQKDMWSNNDGQS